MYQLQEVPLWASGPAALGRHLPHFPVPGSNNCTLLRGLPRTPERALLPAVTVSLWPLCPFLPFWSFNSCLTNFFILNSLVLSVKIAGVASVFLIGPWLTYLYIGRYTNGIENSGKYYDPSYERKTPGNTWKGIKNSISKITLAPWRQKVD